jgi:hypothetical protein
MNHEEDGRAYVLATARELYGRVVYSHKTHEKERELWGAKICTTGRTNVVLVSLTTFSSIVSVALRPLWSLIVTAVLATITTAFVLWQANFDPVGKENHHRAAAKELLWIREQLLLLIERCHVSSTPLAQLQSGLDTLTRELTSVYKFAPSTSPEAYGKADASLKKGEFTFSDEEIDAFLPTALRKNTQTR